jgi:hypothetical protein
MVDEARGGVRMLVAVAYLALGLTWTFRSVLGVVANPEYYDPVTTVDWIAVWSYSLALAFVAVTVPLLARDAGAGRVAAGIAWIAGTAALLAAVANGVEDGVGIASWGAIYVVGTLSLALALLALGAALWIAHRPRHAAVAIVWLLGFAMINVGLSFLVLIGSIIAIDARRRAAAHPDH